MSYPFPSSQSNNQSGDYFLESSLPHKKMPITFPADKTITHRLLHDVPTCHLAPGSGDAPACHLYNETSISSVSSVVLDRCCIAVATLWQCYVVCFTSLVFASHLFISCACLLHFIDFIVSFLLCFNTFSLC